MARYVVKRLLMIPTLLGVAVLFFFLMRVVRVMDIFLAFPLIILTLAVVSIRFR